MQDSLQHSRAASNVEAFEGYGNEQQGEAGAPLQCRHDLMSELEQMRVKHADAMYALHFWRQSAESLAKEPYDGRLRLGAPSQQQNASLALAAAPAGSSDGNMLQQPASEHGQTHVQLDVMREPQVAREERVSICILVSEAATSPCPSLQQVSLRSALFSSPQLGEDDYGLQSFCTMINKYRGRFL